MQLSEIVSSIGEKIDRLILQLEVQKEKITRLESDLNDKEEKIKQQKRAFKKLQEENKVLKISNGLKTNEGDGEFAKKEITLLMKEIESCIAILDSL